MKSSSGALKESSNECLEYHKTPKKDKDNEKEDKHKEKFFPLPPLPCMKKDETPAAAAVSSQEMPFSAAFLPEERKVEGCFLSNISKLPTEGNTTSTTVGKGRTKTSTPDLKGIDEAELLLGVSFIDNLVV